MPPQTVSEDPAVNVSRRLPGPPGYLLGATIDGLKDALTFNSMHWKTYGDCIRFSAMPGVGWCLFVHPQGVEHILQTNQSNYVKPQRFRQPFGLVGGQGILTSEGDFWRKQRRLIQPAFHRNQLAKLGEMISKSIESQIEEWENLEEDQVLDLFSEMTKLTFRIIGRTLFGDGFASTAAEFLTAFDHSVDHINAQMNSAIILPAWVPTPANRKFKQSLKVLDDIVYGIIKQRRQMKGHLECPQDLLNMLITAETSLEEAPDGASEGMSDRQLRDEIMTLLVSGHETVALALTWTFYLLSRNPQALSNLLNELDSVLSGSPAKMEDLHRLPYNKMVFSEALRMYPPIWGQPRQAIEEDEVQGYRVPKDMLVTVSQYLTHRHPEFFPEPEKFDPERFLPENEEKLPRFAYFPFGGGARACIGNHFALAEGQMAIATILQRLRFDFVSDRPVMPKAACTLRPRDPIMFRLQKRKI